MEDVPALRRRANGVVDRPWYARCDEPSEAVDNNRLWIGQGAKAFGATCADRDQTKARGAVSHDPTKSPIAAGFRAAERQVLTEITNVSLCS